MTNSVAILVQIASGEVEWLVFRPRETADTWSSTRERARTPLGKERALTQEANSLHVTSRSEAHTSLIFLYTVSNLARSSASCEKNTRGKVVRDDDHQR
jgi:hypothetical protein